METLSAILRKYANYRATDDDMSAAMFRAADELDRNATLETAVMTIIKAMQSYLPPDSGVSEKDFISEVIGAVDNRAVFAALHGTSDAGNDSLKRALEKDHG